MRTFQLVFLLAVPCFAAQRSIGRNNYFDRSRELAEEGVPTPSGNYKLPARLHLGLLDGSYFEAIGDAADKEETESFESDYPSMVPLLDSVVSSQPSDLPSDVPSAVPSAIPSSSPSALAIALPSGIGFEEEGDTVTESDAPSLTPSSAPSEAPTIMASSAPSDAPSLSPSAGPSDAPSTVPSMRPSSVPSTSMILSDYPSAVPSDVPSVGFAAEGGHDEDISSAPSDIPSQQPSLTPSDIPTVAPSSVTTNAPSDMPSLAPSIAPSSVPSNVPSQQPSDLPSVSPSSVPSTAPSVIVSDAPSDVPSTAPSNIPSEAPTVVIKSDYPSASPSTAFGSLGDTEEPTQAPTAKPFEFSVDNFYTCDGEVNVEFIDAVELTVNYEYQLQLDVTVTDENTDINGIVESIEQHVLESAMENTCLSDIDSRKLQENVVMSASASPADYPYRSCGHYCYNMQGAMIFKLDASDPRGIATVYCDSLEAIHVLFDSEELLSIPNVQTISFTYNGESRLCNFGDSSGPSVGAIEGSVSQPTDTTTDTGRSFSAQSYVAIGAFGLAAAFVILGSVIISRTKLGGEEDGGKVMGIDSMSSDEESGHVSGKGRLDESESDSKSAGLLRGWEQPEAAQRRPSNCSSNNRSGNWDPIATLGFSEIDLKDDESAYNYSDGLNE